MILTDMNVILHQFHNFLRVVAQILAQMGIVEVGEELDHVVDDGIGEHALGGVDLAVFLQLLGSGHATVGQLLEALLQLLVLVVVDVDTQADIGLIG